MEWTQEAVARLRVLWDEGHSTTQIGLRLGCNKNMVVGKAHRLDLPKRGPSPKRKEGSPEPEPRQIPRAGRFTLPVLASLEGVEQPSWREPIAFSKPNGCLWLLAGGCHCNDPVARGSFCADHADIVYAAPEKAAA
jgi:GcrA cell cycle regulator